MIEGGTPEPGPGRPVDRRILIYSYDTFGLGHLRRSRTIANALVAGSDDVRAVIVSGSPVADRYASAERIACVAIPPVTKRGDGGYASLDPDRPLDSTVAARQRIIADTAEAFRPDVILVDKEPTGFHGEMLPTLERQAARGGRSVLGLRDVLDEAGRLVPEWARKDASAAVRRLYDEIWIYGVPSIHRPLAALPVAAEVADRTIYTGYLLRGLPPARAEPPPAHAEAPPAHAEAPPAHTEAASSIPTRAPFLLVTPGGGGDGASLIDWVLSAYEADPGLPLPALVAFGPFLAGPDRARFRARIAGLPGRLAALDFDAEIERLIARAAGIVAMGGYNTFCEILSFDKRAIVVPRTAPRREQAIRAEAAGALGLVRVLLEEDGRAPQRMAAALRGLPDQPLPSGIVAPGLLDGLDAIRERFDALTAVVPLPRQASS